MSKYLFYQPILFTIQGLTLSIYKKKEVAKLRGCEVEIKDGEKTAKGKVVLTEKIRSVRDLEVYKTAFAARSF